MRAAVVIEGVETHTRTGFVDVDLARVPSLGREALEHLDATRVQIPATHAKLFGWYGNATGSYTNLVGDLMIHVYRRLE